jgi:hypothetical protein
MSLNLGWYTLLHIMQKAGIGETLLTMGDIKTGPPDGNSLLSNGGVNNFI